MKKLIKLVLVFAIGMVIGYVFHNTIDTRLKAKFGTTEVTKGKQIVENSVRTTVTKGKQIVNEVKSKTNETNSK